ncbi:MAG: YegS/Rv2252/BmrU family lipid kinase [candidate division SR1 bacterium]|nr:YegS/Rv2252/BmrU family lipid kinase [candidate division SR1 bacterium]
MQRKYFLILNSKSRKVSKDKSGFLKALSQHGIEIERIFELSDSNNLKKQLSTINPKSSIILIASGDGAVSSVIDYFVYTEALVGIIPMGTANSFARSLGIPSELNDALEVIKANYFTQIDLGKIGNDYFANTANIGISSLINQSVNDSTKSIFGRSAYLFSAVYHLLFAKSFDLVITDENKSKNYFRSVELLIANGQYQGGINLAPNASLKSSQINLRIVKAGFMSKFKLLVFWLGRVFGQTWFKDIIVDLEGKSFLIETKPKLRVDIDGEGGIATPFEISIAPKAINIIIKENASKKIN